MGLLSTTSRSTSSALILMTVPFTGVLVRYRVDHRPKDGRLRLNDEDEDEYIGPKKRWLKGGYVDMARRVYRLEVRAFGTNRHGIRT